MNKRFLQRGLLPVIGMISTAVIYSATCVAATEKKEPWQLAEETEVWEPVPAVISVPASGIPSDATVLFDGKNLNQWQGAEGGAAKWKVADGTLTVVPKTGDIKTKESFCDVQLHVEWKTPTLITDENGKLLEAKGAITAVYFCKSAMKCRCWIPTTTKPIPMARPVRFTNNLSHS